MKRRWQAKFMMKSARPSEISGSVSAPPSKSMMQRAVAASLLSEDLTQILNPSFCDDCLAALDIARCLGAVVLNEQNRLMIRGGIKPQSQQLNCRESGLCLRMFSPLAALAQEELVLTGSGTLCRRPVVMVEAPLKNLGVSCWSENGFPPLRVKGPLKGGEAIVDGSLSSQFLTGLLLALPVIEADSVIHVKNLKSKPYIDLTLKMLEDFKIHISHDDYKTFLIKGRQTYRIGAYKIEGDWSSASFLFVAGALGGKVTVKGLNPESVQADRRILEALESCGASARIGDAEIHVEKSRLKAFSFDATDCPDLFPPLAVLACACDGRSRLKGVGRLLFKESNRAEVLQKEFSELGARICLNGDWLEIEGSKLSGGIVNSHGDHRIAMAAAVAGVISSGDVTVKNPECVSKSYPGFFEDFKKIGGSISE
jgi:3-phosphoshikimate 1-carboxyvinyltransferase